MREPKPPFGIDKKRWNRYRTIAFATFMTAVSVVAFRTITAPRLGAGQELHQLSGQELALVYEVVDGEGGCGLDRPADELPAFYAVHPGQADGPLLVPCESVQECVALRGAPPGNEVPRIPLTGTGDQSHAIDWHPWLRVPTVLVPLSGPEGRGGGSQRMWGDEGCFAITRVARLHHSEGVAGELEYDLQIRFGSTACDEAEFAEPELSCAARQHIRLRPVDL